MLKFFEEWHLDKTLGSCLFDSLKRLSIGEALKNLNHPEHLFEMHSWYMKVLYFGHDTHQPGVSLASTWYERNLGICERVIQNLENSDRAFILIGAGHGYLLKQCLLETSQVEIVDAKAYLPIR